MNSRIILLLAVVMAQLAVAPDALAASAEERMAESYLEAAGRNTPERLVEFFHPDEITRLRTRVLNAVEAEATAGGDAVRGRLFGTVTSLEEVRRLTPGNLFSRVAARAELPGGRVEKVEALGTVEENDKIMHVLARVTPPASGGERSHVEVVTFLRYGKGWRVALPVRFQEQVDALLSGSSAPQQEQAEAPAAPNTRGIEALLEASVDLLANGKCKEYFTQQMSPDFRAITSPQALQRLIVQCERSVDTRETYIAALRVAQRSLPKYEDSGERAVYDMAGKGLPFQRFVLERVDLRWYIAE